MPVIPSDDIWNWFAADGWNAIHADTLELEFRSGRDMPEGMYRVAVLRLGFDEHQLQMWLESFDGRRALVFEGWVSIRTVDDLALKVPQLGPRSYMHVIVPFGRAVDVPESALRRWAADLGYRLEAVA